MKRKTFQTIFAVLLLLSFASLFSGCGGAKAPDSLTILADGEEVTVLDVPFGTEQFSLTAALSPADYQGEILWTSEDSGMIKVAETNGTECTLIPKKLGSAKITAECGGVSASVRVHVFKDQDNLLEQDTALTIHGVPYSTEKLGVYYAEQFYRFMDGYGEASAYYGLESTCGIQDLSGKYCRYVEKGMWRNYFLNIATDVMAQVKALCAYAEQKNVTLSEQETAEIQKKLDALDDTAAALGYVSADAYLNDYYGIGITTELYAEYLEDNALAAKVYDLYAEKSSDETPAVRLPETVAPPEDEDRPLTAMRHLLIMAEANEFGNYTEEAIAAAHDRAAELYEEWLAGDQTEDSFAALAAEYSEDPGSVAKGGLYTDIYQGYMVPGIDQWLFAEGRAVGDTILVDNNGDYVGTHIVYFLGYCPLSGRILSHNDLRDVEGSDWFRTLMADYVPEPGAAYDKVGIF